VKDFSTMQIKRTRKKMETLCAEDGDRIKDDLISHFKYFIFFEVVLGEGERRKG